MTLLRMLAFAPLAAPPQHTGAQIDGSGLHTPSAAPAKQTPSENLPAFQTASTDTAPAQTAATTAADDDTPPWQEPAANAPQTRLSDGLHPSEEDRPSEHTSDQTAAATSDDDTPPWQESAANAPQTPLSDGLQPSEDDRPSEQTLPASPVAWQLEESTPFDDIPPADEYAYYGDDILPPLPQDEGMETGEPGHEEGEDEGENADDFAPLPELNAANWHAVIKRLGKRLGAAQMLADHMAWTEDDTAANRILFALNGNSQTTTTKEYFDKISQTLADAYNRPGLSIQTQAWQDGAGWETPAMRRVRLQHEGREEARGRLENDPACRRLMAGLEAAGWEAESLQLAENLEN